LKKRSSKLSGKIGPEAWQIPHGEHVKYHAIHLLIASSHPVEEPTADPCQEACQEVPRSWSVGNKPQKSVESDHQRSVKTGEPRTSGLESRSQSGLERCAAKPREVSPQYEPVSHWRWLSVMSSVVPSPHYSHSLAVQGQPSCL
jgi:hypothetical protein